MWRAQLVISSADRSSASIQVIHNTSWLHRERNRSRCCSYRTACRVEPTRPRDARVQASTHRHCLRSLLRRRIRRQLRPHGNASQSLRVDRRESDRSGVGNCDLAFRGPTGAGALDSVVPRGCVSKKIVLPYLPRSPARIFFEPALCGHAFTTVLSIAGSSPPLARSVREPT